MTFSIGKQTLGNFFLAGYISNEITLHLPTLHKITLNNTKLCLVFQYFCPRPKKVIVCCVCINKITRL